MDLEALRRHGFGVAYRMLGSVAEAEDVAQEALLRLTREERTIDEPAAWITTVATRLSISVLQIGAGAARVLRRAVAPGAAARGPGARPGLTRGARRLAVAGVAGAAGAPDAGRAGRVPPARGVRLRLRGDRRDHRPDRGQLATARDPRAQARGGQPPALRCRRGGSRRSCCSASSPPPKRATSKGSRSCSPRTPSCTPTAAGRRSRPRCRCSAPRSIARFMAGVARVRRVCRLVRGAARARQRPARPRDARPRRAALRRDPTRARSRRRRHS